MAAHSIHASGTTIVQDRRFGATVERSTFDLAGAIVLRGQLDAAIAAAQERTAHD